MLVSGDGTVFSVIGAKSVAKVTPLSVVVMGDSFSSGEGAEPGYTGYREGTGLDAVGQPPSPLNRCHRSDDAYAALLRPRGSSKTFRALGGDSGDGNSDAPEVAGFSWQFLACSGATTRHFRDTPHFDEAPQISQLGQLFPSAGPDLIVLTLGGNDAEFADLMTTCAFEENCQDFESSANPALTWSQYLTPRIQNEVRSAVRLSYQQLLTATGGSSTVVALGYPQLVPGVIANAPEHDSVCRHLRVFEAPFSLLRIDAQEQTFLRALTSQMNDMLEEVAAEMGIHFLRIDWGGHEPCGVGDVPWIHGIREFRPVHSFHPTAAGQAQYAEALNQFLIEQGTSSPYGFFVNGLPKNPVGESQ